MRPRLLLSGPIGCGKSTLIRQALGRDALRAGGYVTLRITEGEHLLGFDLAPAAALADSSRETRRFLDFTDGIHRDDSVFSGFGADLLRQAPGFPFAVADEFGGLELQIPEFRQALLALWEADVPLVGVLKTREASAALIRRLGLSSGYAQAYEGLLHTLESDPGTRILPTVGRGDAQAEEYLRSWVNTYVRK